mmetsp:Transcript_3351/g.12542  ORF Transcript_3351/g.12542 Transcript_3351/m.12542 type:complete len:367 (+) Transcript_3351:1499-2599(+)
MNATLCSSAPLSSSPSRASSAVRVYLAKRSQRPPSAPCVDLGQSFGSPDSSFARLVRPPAARTGMGTALSLLRLSSVRRAFLATPLSTPGGLRRLPSFSNPPPKAEGAASSPMGSIGRRRTVRRSASLSGVKHIGHFAGSPSFLTVAACRAMHGKQNACPHSVTCAQVIGSSRHTGHDSGVAEAISTNTTSSQSTMWSGSDAAPLRSAQSATRKRKLAWRKSSLRYTLLRWPLEGWGPWRWPRLPWADAAPPPRPPPRPVPRARSVLAPTRFSRCGEVKLRRKSARTPRRQGPAPGEASGCTRSAPFEEDGDPTAFGSVAPVPLARGTARGAWPLPRPLPDPRASDPSASFSSRRWRPPRLSPGFR